MEDLEEHRRVLRELVSASSDVSALAGQLARFRGYDMEPLVTVGASEVSNILGQFLDGRLSADNVGIWAEALEMRDDVDFGEEGVIARFVFDLASEGLGARPIPTQLAREMLAKLRESPG